jgi:hydroxyacylglutathione hydrolase
MKISDEIEAFIWRNYSENNCNAYLIANDKRILIDPGHAHLLRHVEDGLLKIKVDITDIDVVLVTHAHPDHFEGAAKLMKTALFAMSHEEYEILKQLAGHYMQCPEPDFLLQEGELVVGDEHFEVLVTPGHSPASICLYWPKRKALFTGDVVFRESIGRSDLPGGDGSRLKESIERLSHLDVEYLLPGHGEPVIGKAAVRKNFQAIKDYWFQYL